MHTLDTTATTDFHDPSKRRAWVGFKLRMQGLTLVDIAREMGVYRTIPDQALCKPYPKMERAITKAMGIPVQILFPERSFPNGERSIKGSR